MKDLSDLVLAIVRPLVAYPGQIKLDIVELKDLYKYNLIVAPEDIDHVIGKQGHVAKVIRAIVYGIRVNTPKKVRLSIIDDKEK